MFVTLLVVVFVLVGVLLAFAATRPASMHIERATDIQASPEEIFPLINDFRRWSAWSPYEKLDPAMTKTYSGAATGKGAVYEWSGNSKAGKGRMEIMDTSSPSRVTIKLDFVKPFEGHNVSAFALVPQGGSTRVTWTMDGPSAYMAKLMGIFVNMDTMIGKDFETGLASLKAITERPSVAGGR